MVLPPVRGARLCLPAPGAGSQQWERWDSPVFAVKHIRAFSQYTHTESKYTCSVTQHLIPLLHKHTHACLNSPGWLAVNCISNTNQKTASQAAEPIPLLCACSPGNTPSGQTAALSSVNNPQCHVALERTHSQHHQRQWTHHTLNTYTSTGTEAPSLNIKSWLRKGHSGKSHLTWLVIVGIISGWKSIWIL